MYVYFFSQMYLIVFNNVFKLYFIYLITMVIVSYVS